MSGLRTALTSCINGYAKKKKLLKNDGLSGDDVREGLAAIVSVKHPDPSFSSQTKDKLVSSEVAGIVQTVVYEKLNEFFEENPSVGKLIVDKAVLASKAREAARKARDLTRRKASWKAAACQVNWLSANLGNPRNAKFTLLRVIPQAVQPRLVVTVAFRPFCPFEEKSSTLNVKSTTS